MDAAKKYQVALVAASGAHGRDYRAFSCGLRVLGAHPDAALADICRTWTRRKSTKWRWWPHPAHMGAAIAHLAAALAYPTAGDDFDFPASLLFLARFLSAFLMSIISPLSVYIPPSSFMATLIIVLTSLAHSQMATCGGDEAGDVCLLLRWHEHPIRHSK